MVSGIGRKIWFTSDTHFGEERTFRLSRRRYSGVWEMTEDLINKWNEFVGENDLVFHLGDFGEFVFLNRLNGKIVLIEGNYEEEKRDMLNGLVGNGKIIGIFRSGEMVVELKDGCSYELVHEPSKFSRKMGRFCLFGHVHKQAFKRDGINVGVDCNWGYPFSEEDVIFFRKAVEMYYDDEVFMEYAGREIVIDEGVV